VVVTFEPHPARILRPDHNLKLLTPLPEKLRLLEATGVDAVLLLPFSRDLSLMTPHQFAHEILKKRLHAREVHEGYNFHFGHKAAGNIQLLRDLGREMGFEVHDYPEMRLRGRAFRAATSASCFPKAASAGRATCWRVRSAFSPPPAADAATERSTPSPPSTWRATKNSSPKMASISPARELASAERVLRFGHQRREPSHVWRDSFAIETHLLNFHPLELSAETEVELHFLDRLRDEIKFPSSER
jgi:riboflavin kinase / FMN adenylyltransferase